LARHHASLRHSRAHPPVRPQAELRPATFSLPEPVRGTPLGVPTPLPRQQGKVSQKSMRAEELSPTARLLKINRRSGSGLLSPKLRSYPPSFGATPCGHAPRRAATAACRGTRVRGGIVALKEEEARRQASKPAAEPPRAMSLTERLMRAKGIQGAGDACTAAKPWARALANIPGSE